MNRIHKVKKLLLLFSNVIDSPVYRQILKEYSAEQYELRCIFIGKEAKPLYDYSIEIGCRSFLLPNAGKSNFVSNFLITLRNCLKFQPKVIFTFGQTATIVGLTAGLLSTRAKRLYLRGHTSMNRVENFSRGIIYDKISNRISNLIVVANDNTRTYLEQNEKVRPQKIVKIEFGFDLLDLYAPSRDRVHKIMQDYSIASDQYVIGIVSRFTPVKGLEFSIPAATNFLKRNPKAILLLAGVGNDPSIELKGLISGISPNQVRLISRVSDMAAFYQCLNVFIHTPIDETVESFGLVYVEAFAAGVPSIVTLSGIAKDIASDGENCLVVDYCDEQGIETALDTLFKDENLCRTLSLNARAKVSSFTLEKMCGGYRDLIERA